MCDDVIGLRVSDSDFHSEGNPSYLRLANTRDVMISGNMLHSSTEAFMKIEGQSTNIMINANNLRLADQIYISPSELTKEDIMLNDNWH